MKTGLIALMLVVLSTIIVSFSFAQWVQVSGLSKGPVSSLCLGEGRSVFAGTGGGVFLSTNSGASWNDASTGLTNFVVPSIIYSSPYLFAGTSGSGVFRSSNNGTSWIAANAGMTNQYVMCFAENGSYLFAGTLYSGMFRSSDHGVSWNQVNNGLTETFICTLCASEGNLYAGTASGLFYSNTNGSSWTKMSGLPPCGIRALVMRNRTLYAATNGFGVYLLPYLGSWTPAINGLPEPYIYSLTFSGTNLFAGTWSGVFLSTDSGASWTRINTGLDRSVSSLITDDSTLFAGTDIGVFVSTDQGTTWRGSSAGMVNTGVSCLVTNETNLFALSDYLRLSTDDGMSWTAVPLGAGASTLTIDGSHVFLWVAGVVYHSSDNGVSWAKVTTNWPAGEAVQCFLPDGGNLFLGTYSDGIYRSTDNGNSWAAVGSGSLTVKTLWCLTICDSTLLAGTQEGGVYRFTPLVGWTPSNTGLTFPNVRAFAVSGTNIFAGTPGHGIFRSTDRGTSWTQVNTGLTDTTVSNLLASGDNIFAGTNDGVFLSTDKGAVWTHVGLKYNAVTALAANSRYLFVGTNNRGVWRQQLSEMITSAGSSSNVGPGTINLTQNYPNPFNPTTTIQYALPHRSHVTLTVYNTLGQQVATLVNGEVEAGSHTVQFDASLLASGVYFYRLTAGIYVASKKLLLIR